MPEDWICTCGAKVDGWRGACTSCHTIRRPQQASLDCMEQHVDNQERVPHTELVDPNPIAASSYGVQPAPIKMDAAVKMVRHRGNCYQSVSIIIEVPDVELNNDEQALLRSEAQHYGAMLGAAFRRIYIPAWSKLYGANKGGEGSV